ncbi:TetR family transcriptional regulator [Blastococcus colisei]|uniref:TetR family transcriptional regulator n=1 Tax=Blastococcus colisei TaxID=1564162 RepID=A0A543PAK6_9ACTN|nr:QsdR family transcriptional regulator [Blastococcus colisei]TQN41118.1 TetR family transcriptional regulator [Blastococcus colisei]
MGPPDPPPDGATPEAAADGPADPRPRSDAGADDWPELARRAQELAARWVHDGRRLDMRGLSAELGVSRVTLFRHVGGREVLLGRALWLLTERTFAAAERQWELGPEGLRSTGVMRLFNQRIAAAPGLRRLLDDEPALAIRVLTDPRGAIQPGVVAAVEALLRRDVQEAGLELILEPGALAFALVRIGESFLYADVLANRTPDVDMADRLQRALIEGRA